MRQLTSALLVSFVPTIVLIIGSCTDQIPSGTDGGADVTTSDVAPDVTINMDAGMDATDAANAQDATDAHVDVGPGFVALSAGDHVCAVMGDGRVACWGYNYLGGVGGDAGQYFVPTYVPGITTAVAVAAGDWSTCALLSNGSVACWGNLCSGAQYSVQACSSCCSSPEPVLSSDGGAMLGATSVSVGNQTPGSGEGHAVIGGVDGGGAVCWGGDSVGECSAGGTVVNEVPFASLSQPSTPFTNVVAVSAAQDSFACYLLNDGTVHCSGTQTAGSLGDGTNAANLYFADTVLTAASTPLTGIGSIGCGYQHCCALTADHTTVYCWGDNSDDALGRTTGNFEYAAPVQGLSGNVVQVASGKSLTCAAMTDHTAQCWGYNIYGQIGNGTTSTDTPTPSTVTMADGGVLSPVANVAAGDGFACAVLGDQTAWCWGYGSQGALGNNLGAGSPNPVQVVMP
jgi:alpha-tubulin suppressor-like RCC1 family protein